jgi:hypothetical protein
VTLLLAAALAVAASFGINHQYDTARVRHTHCASALPLTDACDATSPARPDAVWAFGALAVVLVVAAAGVGARGRTRSVELVLSRVEAVPQ